MERVKAYRVWWPSDGAPQVEEYELAVIDGVPFEYSERDYWNESDQKSYTEIKGGVALTRLDAINAAIDRIDEEARGRIETLRALLEGGENAATPAP